jgi:hypothetical protein
MPLNAEDILKEIVKDEQFIGTLVYQLACYILLDAGWKRCEKCNAWTEPGKTPGYPCGCINPFPND